MNTTNKETADEALARRLAAIRAAARPLPTTTHRWERPTVEVRCLSMAEMVCGGAS